MPRPDLISALIKAPKPEAKIAPPAVGARDASEPEADFDRQMNCETSADRLHAPRKRKPERAAIPPERHTYNRYRKPIEAVQENNLDPASHLQVGSPEWLAFKMAYAKAHPGPPPPPPLVAVSMYVNGNMGEVMEASAQTANIAADLPLLALAAPNAPPPAEQILNPMPGVLPGTPVDPDLVIAAASPIEIAASNTLPPAEQISPPTPVVLTAISVDPGAFTTALVAPGSMPEKKAPVAAIQSVRSLIEAVGQDPQVNAPPLSQPLSISKKIASDVQMPTFLPAEESGLVATDGDQVPTSLQLQAGAAQAPTADTVAGTLDKIFTTKEAGPGPGLQTVKADISTPVITPPHQPGVQAAHAHQQLTAQLQAPLAADIQQDIARAGVALQRVPFEIAVRAHKGEKEFEIRLDPPELGRVDVSMSVDKHGKVATHLVVERSETLDQLRKDAPNLERALQNSGLKTDFRLIAIFLTRSQQSEFC